MTTTPRLDTQNLPQIAEKLFCNEIAHVCQNDVNRKRIIQVWLEKNSIKRITNK
jgi:hypothetical protein